MFDWDESNTGHIARHGITPAEAEQVIQNEPIDLEFQRRGEESRIAQVGETNRGRILFVVTTWRNGFIRVVTAFPAKKSSAGYLRRAERKESMRDEFQKKSFKSEEDEANWWDQQQDALAKAFQRAAAEGMLGRGTAARKGITPTTTIRLAPDDILLARNQAGRRGIKYQTYLKILIHEALHHEERQEPSKKRTHKKVGSKTNS